MKHIVNSKSSISHIQGDDIQPNAVDLRVDKVFKIGNEDLVLLNDYKEARSSTIIEPREWLVLVKDKDGSYNHRPIIGWRLEPGAYEVVATNNVKIADNEAGWVIPRSTLTRNGIIITGGLYDSGYKGVMGIAMHVTSGAFVIEKNARFAQFLLFDAEAVHSYNGSYGEGSEHDLKYTGGNQ